MMMPSTASCDQRTGSHRLHSIQSHDHSGLVGPLGRTCSRDRDLHRPLPGRAVDTRARALGDSSGQGRSPGADAGSHLITVTTYVVAVSAHWSSTASTSRSSSPPPGWHGCDRPRVPDLLRNVLAGIWAAPRASHPARDTITVLDQTGASRTYVAHHDTSHRRRRAGDPAQPHGVHRDRGHTTHFDTRRLTVGVRILPNVDLAELMRRARTASRRYRASRPSRESSSSRRSTVTCPCSLHFWVEPARAGSRCDQRGGFGAPVGCGRCEPAAEPAEPGREQESPPVETSQPTLSGSSWCATARQEWSREKRHTDAPTFRSPPRAARRRFPGRATRRPDLRRGLREPLQRARERARSPASETERSSIRI